MTTGTNEREDLRIEIHEWDERACESFQNRVTCDQAAEWIIHRSPCPTCGRSPKFFCSHHKDVTVALRGLPLLCPRCLVVQFMDVYSIEPIR